MPLEWYLGVAGVLVLTLLGRRSPEPQRTLLWLFAFVLGLLVFIGLAQQITP